MAVALIVISISDCYVCSRLASQLSSAKINTSTVPSSASCSAVFPRSLFISLPCCVVFCVRESVCVHVCLHVQYGHRVVCGRVCSREIPEKMKDMGMSVQK